jgi:hypothetical protein
MTYPERNSDKLDVKKFHPAIVAQLKQVVDATGSKFFGDLHTKLEAGMTIGELNAMRPKIEAEYARLRSIKAPH